MSVILVTVAVVATFVAFMSVISLIALAITSYLSSHRPEHTAVSTVGEQDDTTRLSRPKASSAA